MIHSSARAAADAAREFSARVGKSFAAGTLLAASVVSSAYAQTQSHSPPSSAPTQVASSSAPASSTAGRIIEKCNAVPVIGRDGKVDLGAEARCKADELAKLEARERELDARNAAREAAAACSARVHTWAKAATKEQRDAFVVNIGGKADLLFNNPCEAERHIPRKPEAGKSAPSAPRVEAPAAKGGPSG